MILTVDIGVRNLALCCMKADNKKDLSTYKIHLWNVYNTLDSDDYKCQGIQKNGKVCGKKCSFKYIEETVTTHCCKTHFPKDITKTSKNNFKKKLIDSYLLQDIVRIVIDKIQEIFDDNPVLMEVTQVLLELQPQRNPKMCLVSHVIFGKLVELYRDTKTTIRFVAASKKLKAYTGPYIECKLKGAYASRKWLAVQYTRWFLENKFSDEQRDIWLPFFENLPVKADVSDTALMALNGLFGIPKKQFTHKNGNELK